MSDERGSTLVTLTAVLAIAAVLGLTAAPALGEALASYRAHGATADLYAAVHLTRARARTTGVMHALMLAPDGRSFRVVEDPAGPGQTVQGPHLLGEGVVASGNSIIRFTPRGFAVPAGTITVQVGPVTRKLIVNILGRVRVA